MNKHPVLTAMAISAVICAVFIGVMVARSRSVDEQPFIYFFGLLAFPFVWFGVWLITNGISWLSGMKGDSEKGE